MEDSFEGITTRWLLSRDETAGRGETHRAAPSGLTRLVDNHVTTTGAILATYTPAET
jgi:hypothetical protein